MSEPILNFFVDRLDVESKNQGASWRTRWQEGRTSWDQAGAHPGLLDLLKAAQKFGCDLRGAQVLEPACGRAHNGAVLSSLGASVVSFDIVPEAIDAAKQIYLNHPRFEMMVHDAFVVKKEWMQTFDIIFDRAALCALSREIRQAYVETAWHHLKIGGFFLSIPFTAVHGDPEQGPPFPLPLREMLDLMGGKFELRYAEELPHVRQELGRVAREMLTIWQKI
jgi:hypothetical protein